MEAVTVTIMALTALAAALKLSFHRWRGRMATAALLAVFVTSSSDFASSQSRSRIAGWLTRPELMLDASVWLTLDVSLAIAFCILATTSSRGWKAWAAKTLLWFPGVIIFPALFAMLAWLIFSLPGTDFTLTGRWLAFAVLAVFPILAQSLEWLLPERDIRLELLFIVSLIIAGLGSAATVNGRTAATGTSEIEWTALIAVILLTFLSTAAGLIIHRHRKHL